MTEPRAASEILPTDPRRVKAFASFFKNYMSVSSLIVAAVPIPVTAFNALPTFADHRAPLATYTSLFCFLALGFTFYLRHTLARWMFPQLVAASADLLPLYIGMFVCAEAAFILMATREYVQDLLLLSDLEVIHGRWTDA